MHDIDDETRKEVLGEVLMDEFKAIREYLEDIPKIKEDVHQTKAVVNELKDKMTVLETIVREHDAELRHLKQKAA